LCGRQHDRLQLICKSLGGNNRKFATQEMTERSFEPITDDDLRRLGTLAAEPIEAVHPGALDRHLALKRHAEGGEEGDGGREVVDDDADMVHSLDRHVPTIRQPARDPGVPGSRTSGRYGKR
jgi:hypothetical protein